MHHGGHSSIAKDLFDTIMKQKDTAGQGSLSLPSQCGEYDLQTTEIVIMTRRGHGN